MIRSIIEVFNRWIRPISNKLLRMTSRLRDNRRINESEEMFFMWRFLKREKWTGNTDQTDSYMYIVPTGSGDYYETKHTYFEQTWPFTSEISALKINIRAQFPFWMRESGEVGKNELELLRLFTCSNVSRWFIMKLLWGLLRYQMEFFKKKKREKKGFIH